MKETRRKTKFTLDPALESYGLKILEEKGGQLRLEGIRCISQNTIRVFWTDGEDNNKLSSELVSPPTI